MVLPAKATGRRHNRQAGAAHISTPEVQSRKGVIFWKLTVGKKPMPPFGKKLSDNERWALVHYVRGLKVD